MSPEQTGNIAIAVITGASGFLGRHVAVCLDSHGFRTVRLSRRDMPGCVPIDDYRNTHKADVVIHLAEEPDRAKVNQLGEQYIRQSADIVTELTRCFGRNTVYASSGVVYSDQSEVPCSVDASVYETDTYSRSKLLNERIVLEAGGCVVRLSNLFGLGMATNNVISDIMRQVPGEGVLSVRDDAPVRDFLSVTDAATAFGLIVAKGIHGIVNVGSGVGTSVRTLVEVALRGVGQEHRQIVATAPSMRCSINILDISGTRKLLGWSPADPVRQLSDFLAAKQQ